MWPVSGIFRRDSRVNAFSLVTASFTSSSIPSSTLSRISNLWWYRLSRQKWTNVERELSSMRKETWNDQVDRQKTAFCSLTTDDIAHNCKSGNSPRDHFLPLKPFDSL